MQKHRAGVSPHGAYASARCAAAARLGELYSWISRRLWWPWSMCCLEFRQEESLLQQMSVRLLLGGSQRLRHEPLHVLWHTPRSLLLLCVRDVPYSPLPWWHPCGGLRCSSRCWLGDVSSRTWGCIFQNASLLPANSFNTELPSSDAATSDSFQWCFSSGQEFQDIPSEMSSRCRSWHPSRDHYAWRLRCARHCPRQHPPWSGVPSAVLKRRKFHWGTRGGAKDERCQGLKLLKSISHHQHVWLGADGTQCNKAN